MLVPLCGGALSLLIPMKMRSISTAFAILVLAVTFLSSCLFFGREASFSLPWGYFGIDFDIRFYAFSGFIILAASFFALMVGIYCGAWMKDKEYAGRFYSFLLIAIGFINGAALSDNLVLFLFFGEALLITTYILIAIGSATAYKAATKAFIIIGVAELCMIAGAGIAGNLASTFKISAMHLSSDGMGGAAFLLLIIGAAAKAGAMPFHSWIPAAAKEAPLPFMAAFPGSLEKLLGIYILARISLDIFHPALDSWPSYLLMTAGAATIIFAVMMALIQKEYKRLLSYHAISQVGYMVLGIGTLVPAGIIGGLFHMLNNALYKDCLFMTAGSVEKEAGTTELAKLGGLSSRMPLTFCFFSVAALAISGVWPFNGFFSKEMIYEGALERNAVFYIAAFGGSFLTAISFLKLGAAAFMGKNGDNTAKAKEAPLSMLVPMGLIALLCTGMGIFHKSIIKIFLAPAVTDSVQSWHLGGLNPMLTAGTVCILLLALLNHYYGVRRSGNALGAADHIHYAPVLRNIYDSAEKGHLDPYNWGRLSGAAFSGLCARLDAGINAVYDRTIPALVKTASAALKFVHNGSIKLYLTWSIAAAILFVIWFMR